MRVVLTALLLFSFLANAQKSYSRFRTKSFNKECIGNLSIAKTNNLIKLYNEWPGKMTANFHYDYAGLLLHLADSTTLDTSTLNTIVLHFKLHDELQTDNSKGYGHYNLWMIFWAQKVYDKAKFYMKKAKELLPEDAWNIKSETKFLADITSR